MTLNHLTDNKLSSFDISSNVIFQLIKNLEPNKVHGHEEISVKMLKLCAPSICKPLTLLFENCLAFREFPNVWEKSNIVPVHKKEEKLKKKLPNGVFIALLRKINGKSYVQLNFQFY